MTARILIAIATILVLAACGEPIDKELTSNSATTNNGDGEFEDVFSTRGWIQAAPDATEGIYIEDNGAVLPATCDGDLAATANSDGLVRLTWSGSASNSGTNSLDGPPYDANQLRARPDHASVSDVYRVTWGGQIRDLADDPEVAREGIAEDRNAGALVSVDVCDTAFERGTCFLPSDQFVFDGCIAVQTELPGFLIGDQTITNDGTTWTVTYAESWSCDTETDAPGFPADAERGLQTITFDADLTEGTVVELDAGAIAWDGTYLQQIACEDIENLGTTCECEWRENSSFSVERAWAMLEGDRVYLEVKATGDDGPLWIWGGFATN